MSRTRVIAAYRHAAKLARQHGVTVEFYPGWTSRGRAGFDPRAIVNHDTSDPARLSASRMLQILANGHGAIAGNAICTDAILRDGTVYIVASGLAWHAGRSSWDGLSSLNRWALGTEYQRAVGQQLTARQLEVGHIWDRARMAAFGIPVRRVCEHSECAVPAGRKVDRHRIVGRTWRTRISQPAAPPEPETSWLEDTMAAGEKQLADIAKAIERSAAAQEKYAAAIEALATVETASYIGKMREQYSLPQDPHSDAVHAVRVVDPRHDTDLKMAGDVLRAAGK